ncbi:MAG: DUF4397 domain-containing protein [Thermomicrobiales bacterium]
MVGRYSAPVDGRWFQPVILAGVLMLTTLLGVPITTAQEASPEASPAAMADCTAVLGIGNPGDACVNVIHASPAAAAVDVYVDDALVLSGLEYKQSSGVVAVTADFHQFAVVASGGDVADAALRFGYNFLFSAGDLFEVAVVGAAPPLFGEVYLADLSQLPDDTARARAVHASADAPSVDVAVAGGDVLAENLSFPRAAAYVEVPAGSVDLEVRPTGTTDVALSAPAVQLDGNAVVSVFVVGLVADGSLDVVVTVYPLGGGAATPVPVAAATPAA